jgi:hypothetical protein
MISQVRRIGLFRPLDMILELADEEEKRSNFRTPRLQLPDVVFCFFEKFQIPGFIGKLHFWINTLKRARPQDVESFDHNA